MSERVQRGGAAAAGTAGGACKAGVVDLDGKDV